MKGSGAPGSRCSLQAPASGQNKLLHVELSISYLDRTDDLMKVGGQGVGMLAFMTNE
jgi:hypothetical protein